MAGRPRVPGERPTRGIFNPDDVRNRTVRGSIDTIDATNGFVTLNLDGLPSSGRHASVPWLWASFPEAGKAAWGRYMPFQNDTLKIAFDYDDTPHAVGYETRAGLAGVGDGRAGYPAIVKAADGQYILRFDPLVSGEYDFMSVGGAYIYGGATGELLLTGGTVSLDLVRAENRLYGQAGSYYLRNNNAYIRFGQVKRFSPTELGESATGPWNPSLNGQEFEVSTSYNDGAIEHKVARFGIGNLASDITIELASTGQPKMAALDLYDTTGLTKVFEFEVDSMGSVSLTSLQAPQVRLYTPSATLSINTNNVEVIVLNDWTSSISGKFGLTTVGEISLASSDNITLTGSKALTVSVLDDITLNSTMSVNIVAANIALSGQVVLGTLPTGHAFNGTAFNTAMVAAFAALNTALTTTAAATANPNPTLNPVVNPMVIALQAFFTTFQAAIMSSTSTQVQVA